MVDVVVVGGANIDIKAVVAQAHQLENSNPGRVLVTAGGVGRNIAHNLARLGAHVDLISAIGRDSHGDQVVKETGAAGVDVRGVMRESLPTGAYIAIIDEQGRMVSAVSDMRVLEAVTPDVIRQYASRLEAAKIVVADCNLSVPTLLTIADIVGPRLVIEPVSIQKCQKLLEVLKHYKVMLATPNINQIESMFGTQVPQDAAVALHAAGLSQVVIHAGKDGAFVSGSGFSQQVKRGNTSALVDVTGAGDASLSGIVYQLLQGASLLEAAVFGQSIAAQVIASTHSTLE